MGRRLIVPVAGAFALLTVLAAPAQSKIPKAGTTPAGWEAGSFEVAQHGHAVGTASFRFRKTPQGYESTSLVRVAMQGLDYALSKDEQLTATDQLEQAQLSATVNGEAVNVVTKPDAAEIVMNISAAGKSSTKRLDAHPGEVLLADFDPGALETLLEMATKQNNRDLWAILPKASGSVAPIRLATYADQQGKLDGKEIAVHHLVATIGGDNTDLFSGPDNQLLQAELPQQGFALVRKGFVLTPPAKPIAPAAE